MAFMHSEGRRGRREDDGKEGESQAGDASQESQRDAVLSRGWLQLLRSLQRGISQAC